MRIFFTSDDDPYGDPTRRPSGFRSHPGCFHLRSRSVQCHVVVSDPATPLPLITHLYLVGEKLVFQKTTTTVNRNSPYIQNFETDVLKESYKQNFGKVTNYLSLEIRENFFEGVLNPMYILLFPCDRFLYTTHRHEGTTLTDS